MTDAPVKPFRPAPPSAGSYVLKFMRAMRKREAWVSSGAIVQYFGLSGPIVRGISRALANPPMFARYVTMATQKDTAGNRLYLVKVL